MVPLCALSGCAAQRSSTADTLMQKASLATNLAGYRVGSPDVLNLQVANHPEWSGSRYVEVNGCIDMGRLGGVRVEGMTLPEVRQRIAKAADVPVDSVTVAMTDFASQRVYLFGQVAGEQRSVPYQGPELVTDLLRRVGGITPDGAPNEVRVIRHDDPGSAEPQIFQVDLQAILIRGDEKSNVRIQPYDQIYVPESRACRIGKCLHPLLRPVGRVLSGDS
jgi:polysaccharide export outer membrane protein